jgi:hypothetical protein
VRRSTADSWSGLSGRLAAPKALSRAPQCARMIQSRVLHLMYLSDVGKPLLERFPFEIGTDGRYAFDLEEINLASISASLE